MASSRQIPNFGSSHTRQTVFFFFASASIRLLSNQWSSLSPLYQTHVYYPWVRNCILAKCACSIKSFVHAEPFSSTPKSSKGKKDFTGGVLVYVFLLAVSLP